MPGEIPAEMNDVLFFASILGTKRGQDQVEREARFRKRRLNFPTDRMTGPDFPMKAWLAPEPEPARSRLRWRSDLREVGPPDSQLDQSTLDGVAGHIAFLGTETDFKLRAVYSLAGLRSLNSDEITVRKT